MKLFKNKKGITLVELLAVLVILGIIAAIAVPTVSNLIENTRARADVESANSLVQAARLYSLENPEAEHVQLDELGAYLSNPVVITGEATNATMRFTFTSAGSGSVDGLEIRDGDDNWNAYDDEKFTINGDTEDVTWDDTANAFTR